MSGRCSMSECVCTHVSACLLQVLPLLGLHCRLAGLPGTPAYHLNATSLAWVCRFNLFCGFIKPQAAIPAGWIWFYWCGGQGILSSVHNLSRASSRVAGWFFSTGVMGVCSLGGTEASGCPPAECCPRRCGLASR